MWTDEELREPRASRRAKPYSPLETNIHIVIVIDLSVVARAIKTHLGQRSTSTRVVDDIRHHTLHIAVTFGKVLRRLKNHAGSVSRSLHPSHDGDIHPSKTPRARRDPRANEINISKTFTSTARASPRSISIVASPTTVHETPRPTAIRNRAPSSRSTVTHLLTVLRRALAGVRVGGKNRPLALTATSDNATHVSRVAKRRHESPARAAPRSLDLDRPPGLRPTCCIVFFPVMSARVPPSVHARLHVRVRSPRVYETTHWTSVEHRRARPHGFHT